MYPQVTYYHRLHPLQHQDFRHLLWCTISSNTFPPQPTKRWCNLELSNRIAYKAYLTNFLWNIIVREEMSWCHWSDYAGCGCTAFPVVLPMILISQHLHTQASACTFSPIHQHGMTQIGWITQNGQYVLLETTLSNDCCIMHKTVIIRNAESVCVYIVATVKVVNMHRNIKQLMCAFVCAWNEIERDKALTNAVWCTHFLSSFNLVIFYMHNTAMSII